MSKCMLFGFSMISSAMPALFTYRAPTATHGFSGAIVSGVPTVDIYIDKTFKNTIINDQPSGTGPTHTMMYLSPRTIVCNTEHPFFPPNYVGGRPLHIETASDGKIYQLNILTGWLFINSEDFGVDDFGRYSFDFNIINGARSLKERLDEIKEQTEGDYNISLSELEMRPNIIINGVKYGDDYRSAASSTSIPLEDTQKELTDVTCRLSTAVPNIIDEVVTPQIKSGQGSEAIVIQTTTGLKLNPKLGTRDQNVQCSLSPIFERKSEPLVDYDFTMDELNTHADTRYYLVKVFTGLSAKGSGVGPFVDPATVPYSPMMAGFLHCPTVDSNLVLSSMVIKKELNASGTFQFSIPKTNPNCDMVYGGSFIQVTVTTKTPTDDIFEYNDNIGDLYWFGRVIDISTDVYGNKDVTAEGPMCFLKDYNLAPLCSNMGHPYHYWPTNTGLKIRDVYRELLLSNYIYPIGEITTGVGSNTNLDFRRPSWLRFIQVSIDESISELDLDLANIINDENSDFIVGDTLYNAYINRTDDINMYDWLSDLVGGFDASYEHHRYQNYILEVSFAEIDRPRDSIVPIVAGYGNGLILTLSSRSVYEDANDEYLSSGIAPLIFTENLMDADYEEDYSDIGTTICFLGAEHDSTYMTTLNENEKIKQRFGYATTYDGAPTYDSQSDGIIQNVWINASDYFIQRYGLIPKVVFDDDARNNVVTGQMAIMYRNDWANPISSFKVKAIDLSKVYAAYSAIRIGVVLRAYYPGLWERDFTISDKDIIIRWLTYRCTSIEEDLYNPSNDKYEFERIRHSYDLASTVNTRSSTKNQIKSLQKQLNDTKKMLSDLKAKIGGNEDG